MPSMDAYRMAELLVTRFQESPRMRLTRAPIHVTQGFETTEVMNAFVTDAPLSLPCGRVLVNQLEIPRKKTRREHGIIFAGGILYPNAAPDMKPVPILICNVDVTGCRAAFIQRLSDESGPEDADGTMEIHDHR